MFNFHHVSNTAILYKAGLLQHSVFPPYMQKGLKYVYALCWPRNIVLVTEAELLAAVCIPKLLYHWNSHLILKSFYSAPVPLTKGITSSFEKDTAFFLNPLFQFPITRSF